MSAEPGRTPPDRPIFVLGCPRSGTTLLQLMLHAHPRIAIPPETRFLVPAYRERSQFGDLTRPENRRALARWITDRRWTRFRDLRLDADDVVEQIVAGPPTVGSAVGIVLRAYAQRFDKPRWGDKRPGYWQDIDVLLRMFPDAQIVHLVRDGRACVASLKRMPWWKGGVDGALATWLMALERTRRDTRPLPSGSYHEMRYENLVADPESTLRDLCDVLGEDFDAAMLEPYAVARGAVPKRKTWHVRTAGAVDTAAVESWRDGLEPRELGLVELVAGRRLRAYGYAVSGEGERPRPSELLAFGRDYGRRQAALRHRRFRDARQRRHESAPVAARLTSGQLAGERADRAG